MAFSSDLMVYWYPIYPNYVNGKLLGYRIYYRYRQGYYSWSSYESVNTSSHNATYLKLTNLKPGYQYRVSVAAFTSKGVGPRSYEYSASTGEDYSENIEDITQRREDMNFSTRKLNEIHIFKPPCNFLFYYIAKSIARHFF